MNGWLGDYDGFTETAAEQVSMERNDATPDKVVLSSKDGEIHFRGQAHSALFLTLQGARASSMPRCRTSASSCSQQGPSCPNHHHVHLLDYCLFGSCDESILCPPHYLGRCCSSTTGPGPLASGSEGDAALISGPWWQARPIQIAIFIHKGHFSANDSCRRYIVYMELKCSSWAKCISPVQVLLFLTTLRQKATMQCMIANIVQQQE